jgi:hypothetical protein
LTGATSPEAISRSEASPEAETTSYSPVFISLTISSEVADLDVDLAAGLLLERRDPVDLGVVGAVLDVAGPGDQVDLALALPSFDWALRSSGG